MKDFTLRKRFLDCKSGTSSLFKGSSDISSDPTVV